MSTESALGRWIEATRGRGDVALLGACVGEHAVMEVYAWVEGEEEIVQTLEGVDGIATWLAALSDELHFEIEGQPYKIWVAPPGGGTAERVNESRWVLTGDAGPAQAGVWRFDMSADGLIQHLSHIPDPDD